MKLNVRPNTQLRYKTILLALLLLLSGCGNGIADTAGLNQPEATKPTAIELTPSTLPPQPTATPAPTPFPEYDISLMMVGDNLMHMGLVYSGQQADGSYDYSQLYEDISSQLQAADICIINQETILGGNELGFSGYPSSTPPPKSVTPSPPPVLTWFFTLPTMRPTRSWRGWKTASLSGKINTPK